MAQKTSDHLTLALNVTLVNSIPPLAKDTTPVAIDVFKWTITLKNEFALLSIKYTFGDIWLFPESARSRVILDDGSSFDHETISVPNEIAAGETLTFSGILKMKHQQNGTPYQSIATTFKAYPLKKRTSLMVSEEVIASAISTSASAIEPTTSGVIIPGNTVRFKITSSSSDYFYRVKIGDEWLGNGAYFGPANAGTDITTPSGYTLTNDMVKKVTFDFSSYTGPRYFGTKISGTQFEKEDGTDAPLDPTALYIKVYDDYTEDNVRMYQYGRIGSTSALTEVGIFGSIPVVVYTYYKNQQEDYLVSTNYTVRTTALRVSFPSSSEYQPSFDSFTVGLKQYLKDGNYKCAVTGNDSSNYVVTRGKPILSGNPGLYAYFEGLYYQYTTDASPSSSSIWHDISFDDDGYMVFPDVTGTVVSQNVTFRARGITSRAQALPIPSTSLVTIPEFKYTGPEISNVNISRAPTQRGTNMSIGYSLSIAALGGHNASNVDLYFKRSRVGSTYPTIPDVSHLTLGSDNTVIIQNGISTRLKDDAYTLLTSKPGDWATSYTRYYTRSENPTTHEVTYTPNTSGTWMTNTYYEYTGFDITSIYDVRLVLTDAYGADIEDGYLYKKIFETTLRSSFELVNFASGGTSLSFGMISSNNENEFECALTAKFLSDVICGGKKLIFNDDNTVTWENA